MAQHIGCGGLAMCNLMEGAHKTEDFTKINPYQHIPTLEDGDFSMGESNAIFRYLALKYKPELYPTAEPEKCGKIDFAMDAFVGEVYKHHMPVVYVVMGFRQASDDQAAANKAYSDALAKWGQTFIKGPFVLGDAPSIADFKVVPFVYSAMCCEAKVEGFEVPAALKDYVNAFKAAIPATKMMDECGGYAIAEFIGSKDKLK